MYAGWLVETAAADELYRAPRHPYTLGLLRSFPSLHGPRREMTGIAGSPPDLRQMPSGCVFHPRCRYAMDKCRTQGPAITAVGGFDRSSPGADHAAACWLQNGAEPPPPELAGRPLSVVRSES
jgi:peptide/nickel transport system ATP-binding protein